MSTSGVSDDYRDDGMGDKYPLHDCCEFESVETLRVGIFVQTNPFWLPFSVVGPSVAAPCFMLHPFVVVWF